MADRNDFTVPLTIIRHRKRPCSKCGKPMVLWPHPTTSKYQPLDVDSAIADPMNELNVRCESHFAKCPAAASFRRATAGE